MFVRKGDEILSQTDKDGGILAKVGRGELALR